ncbi:MAG: LuxR C-terminal-related transcriptional regulator [Gemmatimonadales bacterium]
MGEITHSGTGRQRCMMAGVDVALAGLLTAGQAALDAGDWASARSCFEEAVRLDETAAGLDGLAQALFCQGDYAAAIELRERAFARFREAGDDVGAAVSARVVAYLYAVVHGNGAAFNGWLMRARSLIEAAGDCPERARIELMQASVTSDPVARERHLSAAGDIARRHGDTDTVFDVLSHRGLHLVARGQIDQGMALLDEALAAAAGGEVRDLVAVGSMYCKMLHACELTSDVRRAEDWLELADRFVAHTNRLPISAICRTHYGGILIAAGRWPDAERELATSIQLYDRTYRALRGAAVVRLAVLRVRQGRLEEAAQFLASAEHDSYAVRPQVELHLARGEADLAVARIERFLREHAETELTAPVLFLLVRAQLDQGEPAAAEQACAQLRDLATSRTDRLVTALADHACGLVGAHPERVAYLEAALAAFGRLGLPLEQARARLDLAEVLVTARPAMALVEARAALERFQSLAAARDAAASTALLRRLGVRGHAAVRGSGTLTAREQEVLQLVGQGMSNRDIADRLFVSRRTAEHHVSNILAKLGLTTRAEATAYALRHR